jgi:hypothetical protein
VAQAIAIRILDGFGLFRVGRDQGRVLEVIDGVQFKESLGR